MSSACAKQMFATEHDFHWLLSFDAKIAYLQLNQTWQITGLDITIAAPRKRSFDSLDERRNQSRNDNQLSTRNEKCARRCSA